MVDKPEIIETQRFEDFRGWLSVSAEGFHVVQINQGFSKKAGTLRGLHFQEGEHAQAKLVSCLHGSIFNVAVDIRPGDTFGYAYGEILSFENQKQMLIPRGFAHGYLTLEDDTLMQWCVDNNFCAEAARAVRYDSDFIWKTEPWPVRLIYFIRTEEAKIVLISDCLCTSESTNILLKYGCTTKSTNISFIAIFKNSADQNGIFAICSLRMLLGH